MLVPVAPVFSLQLVAVQFNNAFAIANNVDTSSGTITINLPDVPPRCGYFTTFTLLVLSLLMRVM